MVSLEAVRRWHEVYVHHSISCTDDVKEYTMAILTPVAGLAGCPAPTPRFKRSMKSE